MAYQGIEISEARLLTVNILFSALFLLLIGLALWYFIFVCERPNKKALQRIKKLKARAETDPNAEKELQKLLSKKKRKHQRTLYEDILIIALVILLISLLLWLAIIPGWLDYIKKDYLVYTGNFEVTRYTRKSYITLDDGTRLKGALGLSEGHHNDIIVYSKRTKIALGIK